MKSVFFIALFFLCACSDNKFSGYYEPLKIDQNDEIFTEKKTVHKKDVIIIETTNYAQRIKTYTDQGYVVIGQSVFMGKWEPRYLAVQTARQYGADIVVITSQLQSELLKNGFVPMPQTNVSAYSGNIAGQSVNGTAVGMSTGYVNQMYKEKIYKQKASFLKRLVKEEGKK